MGGWDAAYGATLRSDAVIKSSTFVLAALSLLRVANAALPEPPAQHQPWTPPDAKGIPEYVVDAARALFDAGLADPRGGEYRDIAFAVPWLYSPESTGRLRTHAWVFSREYAVGWNGLIYRVLTVGPAADLDADVHIIAAAKPWSGRIPLWSEAPPANAHFWFYLGSPTTLAPVSIALLLRLGRADLAEELWKAPESNLPFRNALFSLHHEENGTQFLGTVVRSWLGSAFWRLNSARDLDDDQQAVDIGESLMSWEKHVLEIRKQFRDTETLQATDTSFLKPVPALLADSRRRLREPSRPKLDLRALADGKSSDPETGAFLRRPQAERTAYLIDRLEDVRGAQMTFPGQLEYSFDPVYKLLTLEGEAAVEPLLDAYEHDQRLTRTVDYGRPWYPERTPIPVSEVAKNILSDILHMSGFVRDATPPELRDWWQKRKNGDVVARNFELLADDLATADQWLESAEWITLRSDVQRTGAMTSITPGGCSPDKPVPKPFGESLRAHRDPTITQLLVQRAALLALSDKPETACRMALMAYLWDPKAPISRFASDLEACRSDSLFTVARMSAGDSHAAAEWSELIRKRATQPGFLASDLSPLWIFPDNAVMQQTADWLFNRPDAPLAPNRELSGINSPLLTLQAYRQAVLAALEDNSIVGTATRSPEGMLSVALNNGGAGSAEPSSDPRQVPPGQERPVRAKDIVAWELSALRGMPALDPDWPEADKDPIIRDVAAFLELHGSELKAFPARLEDTACPGEYVYLTQ